MNTLYERLLGKTLASIRKDGDVSIILFSDRTAITVNTAIAAHLVAEGASANVSAFEEHEAFFRIVLAGRSYIDISKEITSLSPEIFVFRDADGQYFVG